MAPLPKRKHSKQRKGKRVQSKMLKSLVQLVTCKNCGRPKIPHRMCKNCNK